MSFEPKKLSLIRILQILHEYTDIDHMLTHEQIVAMLENNYGLSVERKVIGRNISLLNEAGFDIITTRRGSYLASRIFEDSELRLLVDSVLASKHISTNHTKELLNKLCALSNRHFRQHVKNIYTVNEWNKTDNVALFYNIEIVDEAIETGVKIHFNYTKFGADLERHKSARHIVSPYQMILHNQKYYLIGCDEKWNKMRFYRMDSIRDMRLIDTPAKPLREVDGYEKGIDYKKISSSLPYMFSDNPENITLLAEDWVIDHVVDWFGRDISVSENEGKYLIKLTASPSAMEFWAMQYLNAVEVLTPISLRSKITNNLKHGINKYTKR